MDIRQTFSVEQINYLQENLKWVNNVRIDSWLADLYAEAKYREEDNKEE